MRRRHQFYALISAGNKINFRPSYQTHDMLLYRKVVIISQALEEGEVISLGFFSGRPKHKNITREKILGRNIETVCGGDGV